MNLNQVTLPVTDIERAIDFYQRLGLTLIVHASHYARFECPMGDATFSIHHVELTPAAAPGWTYFETAELDKKVNDLVAAGTVFEEMPADKPWLWREARLKDPDGNQLILYHAGENRKYPPWRLKDQ